MGIMIVLSWLCTFARTALRVLFLEVVEAVAAAGQNDPGSGEHFRH